MNNLMYYEEITFNVEGDTLCGFPLDGNVEIIKKAIKVKPIAFAPRLDDEYDMEDWVDAEY